MPTGYTATLAQGEQSVADFIRHCGRGMGFLIRMRDDAWDAPLPDKWEPSPYHGERLAELHARKAELSAYTNDELERACDAYYAEKISEREKYIEKNAAQLARYNDMLEKVRSWNPAHPVMVSTREFAIEMLQKSIDFDCNYEPEPVEPLSPTEWRSEQFNETVKCIQYHAAEKAKEEARIEGLNETLAVFKDELAGLSPT
jgi:hypothetical protein